MYLSTLVESGRKMKFQHNPVIFTLGHLSRLSKIDYDTLRTFVIRRKYFELEHYRDFYISKRSGGKRHIFIPHPKLSIAQSWIAYNILNNVEPHECAKAYKKNCSIVDNAKEHCGCDWLLKIDIVDFFEHISERQVYKTFKKLNYTPLLALELTRLCTKIDLNKEGNRWEQYSFKDYQLKEYRSEYIGSLPQGASTSPALSNLVCYEMDYVINNYSQLNNVIYTRYSDDLTFSFIGVSRSQIIDFKRNISFIMKKYGFSINHEKTKIIPPGARKIVTGLIVNEEKPRISRQLKDKIKADLYYCKKYGVYNHCSRNNIKSINGFYNHMKGMIAYIKSIDLDLGHKFQSLFDELDIINLNSNCY